MRSRRLVCILLLGLPLRLAAQAPADDTLRAVELERRNIFDPDERSWLARLTNALHIQTRAGTIRRELLFGPGQPYDSARVAESERNLRALKVFRRVTIDTLRTDSGLVARVITRDGWSTTLDWRFRSTGGQAEYTIGVIENNLLGTASSVAARYRKTVDRTAVTLQLRRPRLIAGRVGFGIVYDDRSDGRVYGAALEQPFFALTSTSGFRLEAENRDERILRFFNGEAVASDTLRHRFSLVRGSAAWALSASADGFTRLGALGQVRREDFRPEGDTASFPRTITGAVGPYFMWNRARFVVTHGYQGFAREEDVDLGITVRLAALVAPKAFGYQRNGVAPELAARVGAPIRRGFGYLEALASGLYDSSGLDSGSVQLAGTAVLRPWRRHSGILHLETGWQHNPVPGGEFDLGLATGPRAFRSHAFTGDRAFFGTAEYRLTVAEDFAGLVGLGVAGFADYGGAWYDGSQRRTGWDAGAGLRLGASRSTDTEALRFDLAYRFGNDAQGPGWVVTIGKGFVFSPLGRRPSL